MILGVKVTLVIGFVVTTVLASVSLAENVFIHFPPSVWDIDQKVTVAFSTLALTFSVILIIVSSVLYLSTRVPYKPTAVSIAVLTFFMGLFFAIAAGMGSRILPPNNACWLDSGSWLSLIVVILAIALVFADKEWE